MIKHGVPVNKSFKITYFISSKYGDDAGEKESKYSMDLRRKSITCKQNSVLMLCTVYVPLLRLTATSCSSKTLHILYIE